MVRWELRAVWVTDVEGKTCAYDGGRPVPLGPFLNQMGEEGWEVAAAVPGTLRNSAPDRVMMRQDAWAGGPWYHIPHWLYLKRPKA
jgi:hypothetical protein